MGDVNMVTAYPVYQVLDDQSLVQCHIAVIGNLFFQIGGIKGAAQTADFDVNVAKGSV